MSDNHKLVIRAAVTEDIEQLLELSKLTGSGMTSMPTDRQSWVDKLDRSIADFARAEPRKSGDIYFMVMEDLQNNNIVGSCAVYAGIGLNQPFYSYKVANITTSSEELDLTVHTRLLNLVNDYTGTTEIGSLFLLPDYRKDGIGKFLSRSRFLLLADFPNRFDETVFAELRGWLDKNDDSPFWRHLGHKFFGLSFQRADFISAVDGVQFISDLMPKYPVYLDLLPEEAQDVVGKPHKAAAAALSILKKEGFRYSGYVDIFDAGPSVQTALDSIKTVADSKNYQLGRIIPDAETETHQQFNDAQNHIISNSRLNDYRMVRATLLVEEKLTEKRLATLSASTAKALRLEIGDQLRAVPEFIKEND